MTNEQILENTTEVIVDGETLRKVNPHSYVYIDGKRVGSGKLIQLDSGVSSPQEESPVISRTPESINQKEVNDVTT